MELKIINDIKVFSLEDIEKYLINDMDKWEYSFFSDYFIENKGKSYVYAGDWYRFLFENPEIEKRWKDEGRKNPRKTIPGK